MKQYLAQSTNSLHFNLSLDHQMTGELIYEKWYAFQATILLANGKKFRLEPKGFWNSKIELKDAEKTILEFNMGWNGILITTFFNAKEEHYLFRPKGLLSSQFVLLDTEKNVILVAESNFKWIKLQYNYTIETSEQFEQIQSKEELILTLIHCINYYITLTTAVG